MGLVLKPHERFPAGITALGPCRAVAGAAAWQGSALRASSEWRVQLTADQIAEIEAGLVAVDATGKPTRELSGADFPLPTLASEITRWREELESGRGFLLVSGVPESAIC